jgi:hypothetical protein
MMFLVSLWDVPAVRLWCIVVELWGLGTTNVSFSVLCGNQTVIGTGRRGFPAEMTKQENGQPQRKEQVLRFAKDDKFKGHRLAMLPYKKTQPETCFGNPTSRQKRFDRPG